MSIPDPLRGLAAGWLALTVLLSPVGASGVVPADPKWRLGFYWSPTADRYPPAAIPWHLYTHINQFAVMPTRRCGLDDGWYGVDAVRDALVREARRNGVKVLITLLQDRTMSAINRCTEPDRIERFVGALQRYVEANGYDGVDVDWEGEVDPDRYQALIRRLRAVMPDRLITADIAMHQRGYLVPLQDVVDRINLMNYDLSSSDYHGRPLRETWHHAALYSRGDRDRRQTAEAGLSYVLESGIRPERVNFGVPFYGYAFRGCQAGGEAGEGCRQPVSAPGQSIGTAGLERIQVEFRDIAANFGTDGMLWDDEYGSPYIGYTSAWARRCRAEACARDAFVTYTDERQMRLVGAFARERHLGGVMTFALHQEYTPAASGDERYPLSKALAAAFAAPAAD